MALARLGGHLLDINMSITRFSGKGYPDKSFTLGVVPREKKKAVDAQYERDLAQQEPHNQLDTIDWLCGSASIGGKFCSLEENPNKRTDVFQRSDGYDSISDILQGVTKENLYLYAQHYNEDVDLEAPLFIRSPKSSQAKRGSYGSHGITGFGRRVVKNACILLEQKYGRERLGFVTCTLPSLPEEIHREINRHWGEITRRFYQKLKRKAESRNREFIYVGVTEIQEKRFEKHGIPCPHLHFVYLCRDSPRGEYLLKTYDYWFAWNHTIYQVLKLHAPHFSLAGKLATGSCHGKYVQKSAAGYLGKYISKGTSVLEAMREAGWLEFPKQWWSACMRCKKMFKDSIASMQSKRCQDIFFNLEKYLYCGDIVQVSFVYIEYGGVEYCAGLSGTFSDSMYRKILLES
jgi:hypothetical protein